MPSYAALVAGATGAVGRPLVKRLLQDPRYTRVTVAARRPAAELEGPGLDWRVVDFDALEAELEGVQADHVFCALGTTMKQAGSREAFRKVDFDYVVALARAGRTAGADRFALNSSVGADPRAPSFYLKVKGEAEDAVCALGYTSVALVRPSLLLAEREDRRLGEEAAALVLPAVGGLLRGALRRYRAIEVEKVACALIGAALEGTPGRSTMEYDDIVRLADSVC